MPAVIINRHDKLPDCCVLCGQVANQKVTLKFAPHDGRSLTKVMLTPYVVWYLSRVIPSIRWSLPFCDLHASQVRFKQKLQPFLVLAGAIAIVFGGWTLYGTNLTWPFFVFVALGVILLVVAHHTRLGPFRVTPNVLELSNASEEFATQSSRLNLFSTDAIQTDVR